MESALGGGGVFALDNLGHFGQHYFILPLYLQVLLEINAILARVDASGHTATFV